MQPSQPLHAHPQLSHVHPLPKTTIQTQMFFLGRYGGRLVADETAQICTHFTHTGNMHITRLKQNLRINHSLKDEKINWPPHQRLDEGPPPACSISAIWSNVLSSYDTT